MTLKPAAPKGAKRARTRDALLVSAQTLLMEQNASALGLRQITDHAGLVHASFYTHFPDVTALIEDLAELLAASHAAAMLGLGVGLADPATRFARITRQSLRIIGQKTGLGRLMFDVGLPAGGLGAELRLRLHQDIAEGVHLGLFKADDLEITASLVAGAISGLALDLHRGALPLESIDDATERLLILLGVDGDLARRLAHEPVDFPAPRPMPMRWLDLPQRPTPGLGETP